MQAKRNVARAEYQAAKHHATVVAKRARSRAKPSPSLIPPATTAAEQAVSFATAQIGCPYVWSGIGPCKSGFDCSGLVMEAWASAGVTIPRTTWDQWADLPSVPVADMRPGDLMILLGGEHVGMYVGHGEMIDAPKPGLTVERIPVAGWPMENLVTVVRP